MNSLIVEMIYKFVDIHQGISKDDLLESVKIISPDILDEIIMTTDKIVLFNGSLFTKGYLKIIEFSNIEGRNYD